MILSRGLDLQRFVIITNKQYVANYLSRNTHFLWSGPCNPCLLSEETDADLWEGWWVNLSTIHPQHIVHRKEKGVAERAWESVRVLEHWVQNSSYRLPRCQRNKKKTGKVFWSFSSVKHFNIFLCQLRLHKVQQPGPQDDRGGVEDDRGGDPQPDEVDARRGQGQRVGREDDDHWRHLWRCEQFLLTWVFVRKYVKCLGKTIMGGILIFIERTFWIKSFHSCFYAFSQWCLAELALTRELTSLGEWAMDIKKY